MGIYFDYDFEDGKEVENWISCFLCGEKKVLLVEYHVRKGPIYTLYKDARKLYSGHEISIASSRYLVCEDCYRSLGGEDEVISAILKKKKEVSPTATTDFDALKIIEEEIEDVRNQISKLLDKLGELHERLERERIHRQSMQKINTGGE